MLRSLLYLTADTASYLHCSVRVIFILPAIRSVAKHHTEFGELLAKFQIILFSGQGYTRVPATQESSLYWPSLTETVVVVHLSAGAVF